MILQPLVVVCHEQEKSSSLDFIKKLFSVTKRCKVLSNLLRPISSLSSLLFTLPVSSQTSTSHCCKQSHFTANDLVPLSIHPTRHSESSHRPVNQPALLFLEYLHSKPRLVRLSVPLPRICSGSKGVILMILPPSCLFPSMQFPLATH